MVIALTIFTCLFLIPPPLIVFFMLRERPLLIRFIHAKLSIVAGALVLSGAMLIITLVLGAIHGDKHEPPPIIAKRPTVNFRN